MIVHINKSIIDIKKKKKHIYYYYAAVCLQYYTKSAIEASEIGSI